MKIMIESNKQKHISQMKYASISIKMELNVSYFHYNNYTPAIIAEILK